MRIFVVEPLGQGGMIHYAYQLCTALADQGAEVTLVTARDYEMESFPHNFTVERRLRLWSPYDPRSMGEKRRSLPGRIAHRLFWMARRALRALRLIVEWDRLTRYLIRQRPDLVQFGKINFPFEAFFFNRMRRRGLVLSNICHEFELRERGGGFLTDLANRAYTGIYGGFAAIFLHAEDNRRHFLEVSGVPAERTHVIPMGNESLFIEKARAAAGQVDLRARYGLGPDEPVVVFFGNLTYSKGIPELLDAFALVAERSPAKLVIAGYPTKFIDMGALHAQVARLGLDDRVIFDPRYIPIEEVGPLMALARVVVFPYRNSTQSASLQVAYSFGRPVVTTDVGGLPEAVEQGRSGYSVPQGDAQAMADAILTLVENPALAEEMGAYARHLSETRFAWSTIAAQIMAVYRALPGMPQG
ncbi:MAG: hypothetical protein Kow00124_24560 [Anaerolineae bacterium]